MKKVIDIILKVLGILFVVALLLFAGWLVRGCTPVAAIAAETTAPTIAPTAAPTAAPIETVTAETAIPTETISAGIDQPSKSWFLAKAGSLVSGDVAIFDGDNNSKKTALYDSEEHTADVMIIAEDIYLWAEWGCYYVEQPNQATIDTIINNKIADGYTVRVFTGLTKLGTNTPELFPAA